MESGHVPARHDLLTMDGITWQRRPLPIRFQFLCRFVRRPCNVIAFTPDHRPFPPVGTGSRDRAFPTVPRSMTIYIGNLSFQAEQEHLFDLFSEYGEVKNCSLPLDRETGRKRGFAFVEMVSEDDEQKAIDDLQDVEWMGRMIRVSKATPRERTGGPRGGGGGGYRG